jgi:hypothetical protein
MGKRLEFSTLLAKISSVFKSDAYIIKDLYCLGGMESEEKLYTQILLEMSPEAMDVLKEQFPDKEYVYITDMKTAKTNLDKAVNFRVFTTEQKDLKKRMDEILKFVNKTDVWKQFEFTEEEASYIFNDGYSLEVFGEGTGYPPVTITKNLFPLVTAKRLSDLYYQIYLPDEEDEEELVSIITQLDMGHYKIYNLIQYVEV